MDYQEALKQVQKDKPKDHYLIVTFSYDNTIVLPHKDGQALLATLAHAETFTEHYGDQPPVLEPMSREGRFRIEAMSAKDYERIKIAQLLGVNVATVKEAEKQAKQPPPTT